MQSFGKEYPAAIYTPWGERVWYLNDIPNVLQKILIQKQVILGGDIITSEMKYTHDSWHYKPICPKGFAYSAINQYNTEESINVTKEYIDQYIKRNGKLFLCTLYLCSATDAYIMAIRK